MQRFAPRSWVGLAILACLAIGCGEEASPTRDRVGQILPPKLDLSPAPTEVSTGVPRIIMILPRKITGEVSVWEQAARRTVGNRKAIFETRRPGKPEETSDQSELIRLAALDKASCLIVIPEDPTAIAPAIIEAREQRVPSVSIGRPIPVRDGVEPIPAVGRTPYDQTAPVLVKAATEDAQLVGFPPEGPAFLLVNAELADAGRRAEALNDSAKASGVQLLGGEAVRFRTYTEASEALKLASQGGSKLAIVLVTDDLGFRAAISLRENLEPDDRYVVAGYISQHVNMNMVKARFASAVVEFGDVELGRMAADAALRLARGEDLPPLMLQEPTIDRATGPPSREKLSAFEAVGEPISILALGSRMPR